MKWEGRRQSDNVEDRRGMSTAGKVAIGGGTVGLLFLLVQLFLGGDSADLLNSLQNQMQQPTVQSGPVELTPEEKVLGDFASTVLADTEDIWHKLFQERGMTYREPKMVLFKDAVRTSCGGAQASSGPFYCPGDETVYMDMTFFNTLRQRFGARGGDFAIAYVIAHEVGHHVQNLLGILKETNNIRSQVGEVQANKVQVSTELQADFLAGVWAHHNQKYLEEGDAEEAINAAASVGDDNIQKQTQGYTVPESYTHGTSEQRVYWFTKGFRSGNISEGDTFRQNQ